MLNRNKANDINENIKISIIGIYVNVSEIHDVIAAPDAIKISTNLESIDHVEICAFHSIKE